jgi:hypothetical protein
MGKGLVETGEGWRNLGNTVIGLRTEAILVPRAHSLNMYLLGKDFN